MTGAFATFTGAFFAVFVMLGAGFAAIVLAVTGNRMSAQFAGAFWAVAGTFTVDHGVDSIVRIVRCDRSAPVSQV